jgi:hypothetical protein
MAELILTEEEKASASWANLDEESLGKLVKASLARYDEWIEEGERNENAYLAWLHSGIMLAIQCKAVNSDLSTYTIEGLHNKVTGERFGDYRITIERIDTE